jgi:glycosyltransferase involved in cell wall biosynthesis
MIVIDSVYIHCGGGLILLNTLLDELENRAIKIVHLRDDRNSTHLDSARDVEVNGNRFLSRLKFYSVNRNKIDRVLCFGNIPPPLSIQGDVFVYFHQRLLLEDNLDLLQKLKLLVIKALSGKTDKWLVQTESMKSLLERRLVKGRGKIQLMPFYSELPIDEGTATKSTYLYVSSGAPHKNHMRLLNAFKRFSVLYPESKLILTIEDNNDELLNRMTELKNDGVSIDNYTRLNRTGISKLLCHSEYVIYPSLSESFGLGLIEACQALKPILASDYPYVKDVCIPSDTFDPLCEDSIFNCLKRSRSNRLGVPIFKTKNNIHELIEILRK